MKFAVACLGSSMQLLYTAAGSSLILMLTFSRAAALAGPPIVLNTWAFTNATNAAWDALQRSSSALDAVEQARVPKFDQHLMHRTITHQMRALLQSALRSPL